MRTCHLLFLIVTFLVKRSIGLHPVILVPGDGGSQMDAKLDKPAVVHYLCDKKTPDYFNIWLNLELLVPLVIDCWVDNLRLTYNTTTRKTDNSPGVDIRVPGWGNTSVVEFLDPSEASPGLYFKTIVEASLLPLGYKRDVNIRGAPYDFRKAPNELQFYFEKLKSLVEETYAQNNNTSVVFICHSMGAPMSSYFLYNQTTAWKQKYMKALITVGGVWGGSVKALKVFAAGDDLGAYVLPSKTMRREERTNPSTAWLLPNKFFWNETETLVRLGNERNYTIKDYAELFSDMNYPEGYEMFKDTKDLLGGHDHPGVEIHCLYGSGVSTVEALSYKSSSYFPDKPTLSFGNGDGTVNIRSLRGCKRWQPKSRSNNSSDEASSITPKIYDEEFPGADHMAVLTDSRILNYIKSTLQKMHSAQNVG